MTSVLFVSSLLLIVVTYALTRHWGLTLGRVVFCLYSGLSFWLGSVYLFWFLGFDIKVGAVRNGSMPSLWWLPLATFGWCYLAYRFTKPTK